jgi:hypothetical protein
VDVIRLTLQGQRRQTYSVLFIHKAKRYSLGLNVASILAFLDPRKKQRTHRSKAILRQDWIFRVSEGGFCADADAGMMVCGRCNEVTQAVFDA